MLYLKATGAVVAVIGILMALPAHPSKGDAQKAKEIQQRIAKVETNLVDLKQSINPFIVFDSADTPKSIRERMEFYKVPGVGVAIINLNEIEWAKSFGVTSQDSRKPVNHRTMFEAASATKMIVACIVLHLVEKGACDLDRDVNDYLRSWKIPKNEFTKKKKVTLRSLLTHQAGLPETNFPQDETMGAPTLTQVLKGEWPAKNKPAFVEFEPGSAWNYSNMGYVVIQKVLEDTQDKPLGQIARKIVFEPLAMRSSTFEYPLDESFQRNEAMPHDAAGAAQEPSMVPTALAQGGLMTTPSDMARFMIELMKAFQGKSHRILSKEMTRRMFAGVRDVQLAGAPCRQGLGVFLFGQGKDLIFFHTGLAYPGATSWAYAFPERGTGAVIMTNGANGIPLMLEIIGAITREYHRDR